MLFIAAPFGNYLKFPNTLSVVGTYTLHPRKGRLKQIIKTLRYVPGDGWVNRLELRNPGIVFGLSKYKQLNEVLSITGLTEEEWFRLLEIVPHNVNLELNLSCPNIEENGIPFYIIKKFISKFREWMIVKISPLSSEWDIDKLVDIGFRQFHCCNTLPHYDGGLSGRQIIPYASKHIRYIKEKYGDVEVIAGGGINCYDMICYYDAIGADHFSLGTVCFNPFKLFSIIRKSVRSSRASFNLIRGS